MCAVLSVRIEGGKELSIAMSCTFCEENSLLVLNCASIGAYKHGSAECTAWEVVVGINVMGDEFGADIDHIAVRYKQGSSRGLALKLTQVAGMNAERDGRLPAIKQ